MPVPTTVLGLDEAGRGSLIGPLVVGGFLAREERIEGLRGIGVADSKELNPAERETVYRQLPEWGECFAVEIPPATIDRYVRRGWLNRLEAEQFARLVTEARPTRAYVDACDPVAPRFGALVRRLSTRPCPVHAAHHADRDLPIVGAASIVAKVRRDQAVDRLRKDLGVDFGTGYPSDERTVEFVRASLEEPATERPWLRASWATTERLMQARSARALEEFDK